MMSDPFQTRGPLIAASILSADFARLGDEMRQVLQGGADMIHLDVMDGHFVPNISFGPPVVQSIRPATEAFFDAHLMISEPLRYAPEMVRAGAQCLTLHLETMTDPLADLAQVRRLGCRVGVTLNPATPVESLWPVIDQVDMVLVMSVVPGFSGQTFMPEVLDKVRQVRRRLRPGQRLEIDGGMNPETIGLAAEAGADTFVVASAIFGQPDRAAAIARLRKVIGAVSAVD